MGIKPAVLILLCASALFAACAPAPAANVGTGGASMLPGQDAANAQATLAAASLVIQATEAAAVQQTAVAAQATNAARAEQTAVAEQITREAIATRQALEVEQTAVAMQMVVDEATRQAQAEQTAVAVTIASEQVREMQRSENVLMLRQAESERLESSQFWKQVFNGLMAALMLAAIVVLFMIGGALVSRVRWLNREPVRSYPDQSGVNILVMPQGLFGTEVRQIGRATPALGNGNGAQIALPAPREIDKPLPAIKSGNVLIAGPSGSGKSTAMRAIIRDRANVTVLDPHAAPGEWAAQNVVSDFDAIADFMDRMVSMLHERKALRNSGQQIEFEPLTVATDELPAIVDELGADVATAAWKSWLRQGRKFSLFVILSTQSARVKTLGISGEGDLREAFQAVLRLGSEATINHADLVHGQERPATLEVQGRPAHAVVVPYIPAFRNGAHSNGNGHAPAVTIEQPWQPEGLETEFGFVPQNEVDSILHYGRRGGSLRGVTRQVYDTTGGARFYQVREVLSAYDIKL